jgi:hypothetical protein
MKYLSSAALGAALVCGGPAFAFSGRHGGGGGHGGGFHGGGAPADSIAAALTAREAWEFRFPRPQRDRASAPFSNYANLRGTHHGSLGVTKRSRQ